MTLPSSLIPDQQQQRRTSDAIDLEEYTQRLLDRVLENIGYDLSTPESRREIREDHQWVRSWRKSASSAKTAATGVGVTMFVSGALWLVWDALVRVVHNGGKP